jgi:hypothetical protein
MFPLIVPLRIALFAAVCASLVASSEAASLPEPVCQKENAASSGELTTSAPALFQRVVLLGASVTAGFTSSEPFGGPSTAQYRLQNFIHAAVKGSHEPITTHANTFLFTNPAKTMEKQIAATIAARPTLVVALDALFWFCYGHGLTSEQRQELLESGLRMLEAIDAPLVLGDIPDASKGVGKVLGKSQMPEISTIAACNERLREWAAARKTVAVIPISELMLKASADEELQLGGLSWGKGKTAALLQPDLLHPSQRGLAGLAIAALGAAANAAGAPEPEQGIIADTDAVYEAALAIAGATQAAGAAASAAKE